MIPKWYKIVVDDKTSDKNFDERSRKIYRNQRICHYFDNNDIEHKRVTNQDG